MNTHSQPKYYLSQNVFCCLSQSFLVFLDLHRDEYICLPQEQSAAILSQFLPHTDTNQKEDPNSSKPQIKQIIEEMVDRGILTEKKQQGRTFQPTKITLPTTDLVGYDYGKKPHIRIRDVFHYFKTMITVSFWLKWRSTEQIMTRLKKRSEKHSHDTGAAEEQRIRDLIEIFKNLRPLFFTAKDHCLFDSFALIEFLSSYDIYPNWVFGVKMSPFAAHCWVQQGDLLLNDSLDHINLFSPIMKA